MDHEIVIDGVTYIRKDASLKSNFKFNPMCQYFTYYSCNPDATLRRLKSSFPNMNSFFVGKKGYCGKVCLEVNIEDITVDFLKRLLYESQNFFKIIETENDFNVMVAVEMSKQDLY